MTWNTMKPKERLDNLLLQFEDLSLGWQEGILCVGVFVTYTLSMLPKTSENEKQIAYWEEINELLNEY